MAELRVVLDAVARRDWQQVARDLAKSRLDQPNKREVVEKVIRQYDFVFLLAIAESCDMLDAMLEVTVLRGKWSMVGDILEHGGSPATRQWAMNRACQLATDGTCDSDSESVAMFVLPQCTEGQVDSVLTALVQKGTWKAVANILPLGVGDGPQRWAVDEACRRASEEELRNYEDEDEEPCGWVVRHCTEDQLSLALATLEGRGLWPLVGQVLRRGVREGQPRWALTKAWREADEAGLLQHVIPHCAQLRLDSVAETLAARKLYGPLARLLFQCVGDVFRKWTLGADSECDDGVFWELINSRCDDLKRFPSSAWNGVAWRETAEDLDSQNTSLYHILLKAIEDVTIDTWVHGPRRETDDEAQTARKQAKLKVAKIKETIDSTGLDQRFVVKIDRSNEEEDGVERRNPLLAIHFIKLLTHLFYNQESLTDKHDVALRILTTPLVVPGVQSVAVRWVVEAEEWDMAAQVRLPLLWEQDRRMLLHRVVDEQQWDVVQQWADHSLHDDQRCWAMGEAFKAKQWSLYLQLADHGLSEAERMNVQCRVAGNAEWGLVRRMFVTVADVTAVKELLLGRITKMRSRLGEKESSEYYERVQRVVVFEARFLDQVQNVASLEAALQHGDWHVVLHLVRRKPFPGDVRLALRAAVGGKVWWAVLQLVRLQRDVGRRDALFRRMVRRRQWAVCRELLDLGVSAQLALTSLARLMRHSQWTLVARVMGYDVGDDVRRRAMQQAMDVREGSVVWQCISNLQTPLSSAAEERNSLFHNSFHRRMWQAVKPLVEHDDDLGTRHRDMALLEAITQHQWDVVDYCQLHNADIDMRDEDGRTPMLRAALLDDWLGVEELATRGGDSAHKDSEGWSALHKVILCEEHDLVKLLVRYQGDINQVRRNSPECPSFQRRTTLQMLIDLRWSDVIAETLLWSPGQGEGVNDLGETVLHVACLSADCPGVLYYLLARGVNPLAETKTGWSALAYAVLNARCPEKMVAECIALGFSPHQPRITDNAMGSETHSSGEDDVSTTDSETQSGRDDSVDGIDSDVDTVGVINSEPQFRGADSLDALMPHLEDHHLDFVREYFGPSIGNVKIVNCKGSDHPTREPVNRRLMLRLLLEVLHGPCDARDVRLGEDERGAEILGDDSMGESEDESLEERGDEGLVDRGDESLGESGDESLEERGDEGLVDRGDESLGESGDESLVKRGDESWEESGDESWEACSDERSGHDLEDQLEASPLVLSVALGMPNVARMLYESGSCSYGELFRLRPLLALRTNSAPRTQDTLTSLEPLSELFHVISFPKRVYRPDAELIRECAEFVVSVSSTSPRSLLSTCRIVVARCLPLTKTRRKRVKELGLSTALANYVMFSDVTDSLGDQRL